MNNAPPKFNFRAKIAAHGDDMCLLEFKIDCSTLLALLVNDEHFICNDGVNNWTARYGIPKYGNSIYLVQGVAEYDEDGDMDYTNIQITKIGNIEISADPDL